MPRTVCLALLVATLALAAPARAQWEPLTLPPELGASQVAIFGFVVAIGDHVFASSGFGVLDASGGTFRYHFVYVSRDRGTTWAPDPAFSFPAFDASGRLGYPASADGALYIPFTRYGPNALQTVARTTDGLTWTLPAGAGLPRAGGVNAQILSATRHAGALYVTHGSNGSQEQATVFRSADNGATWTAVGPPRRTGFLWSVGSHLLIGQPGTTVRGERSANNGLTWVPHTRSDGVGEASYITDAAVVGGVALAGGLRSTDGGATWQAGTGVSYTAACGTVFLGTTARASFSTDGLTSTPWNDGLPASETVYSIACSNEAGGAGGTAYASGLGGLYRRSLSQVTVASEAAPAADVALSVAPNPAAGPATLRLSLPDAAAVRAVVYDALGRAVAVVHDGVLAAGQAVLPLPDGLAPGVYVVRVAAGAASSSVRFTIAR